jgi:hypothetical protein
VSLEILGFACVWFTMLQCPHPTVMRVVALTFERHSYSRVHTLLFALENHQIIKSIKPKTGHPQPNQRSKRVVGVTLSRLVDGAQRASVGRHFVQLWSSRSRD